MERALNEASNRILLVGDVMIRDHVKDEYRQPDHPFAEVVRYLDDAGTLIANLEMPLTTRGVPMPKWSNLRSDPAVISDVLSFGIDAVSLANNHMLDYGPEGLYDTLAACDDAGLPRCGAGRNLDDALEPVMLDVGGSKVAVLGIATTLPVGSEAWPDRPGIAPVRVTQSFEIDANLLAEQPGMPPEVRTTANPDDQRIVCERISALKGEGAFVVVMMHWGVPEHWLAPVTGLLADYQQPLGHALIDAGADVVCGHHSHTLHPIEIYQGRPIFYSLGNFLFERPRDWMEPNSFVIEITLGAQPEYALRPVRLDSYGFPVMPSDDDACRIIERLDALSRTFGTSVTLDDGLGRLVTG